MKSLPRERDVETLLEALDQGADGEPRRVCLHARDAVHRSELRELAEQEAARRGYVALGVDQLDHALATLREDLRHRTLTLIDTGGHTSQALARAAALNPRPHILVSIDGGA